MLLSCAESEVLRYADFDIHPAFPRLLVCIREDHTDSEPSRVKNGLVLVDIESKAVREIRPARADGFYAFPRFGGKDGNKIAWIEVSGFSFRTYKSYSLASSGNIPICLGRGPSSIIPRSHRIHPPPWNQSRSPANI